MTRSDLLGHVLLITVLLMALTPSQGVGQEARPWALLALEGMDDNQPYRRARMELEVGTFLTPLWTAQLEIVPRLLDPSVEGETSAVEGAGEGRVTLKGFVPGANLDVTAGFGGAFQDGTEWVGNGALGVRLPSDLRLTARAGRERYLWTTASVDTLLMLEGVELALHRVDHPEWAGEAVVRHESFPDGNDIRTAWAWVLAPVAPALRVGMAASWQDARETRWSPAVERYEPYFTPEEQRVASVLAEVKVPLGSAGVRLNGSYGIWAREDAPISSSALPGQPGQPGQGRPDIVFQERAYTPWSVVAALDVPAAERLHLYVEAERQETAFYRLDRASVALLVHFGGPPSP